MESADQLNTEEGLLNFLSPYLKVFRSMVPQDYLLPDIHKVNPLNQISQQAPQPREVNKEGCFFRLPTGIPQQRQKNKRKTATNVALDMEASLDMDIPNDQLDAMIHELYSDFCESAQKKIKIESPHS